jgi:glycosyltransferase involved in cell wall biosynthesis
MRPSTITHVVVVVPARDEERLVERCLQALRLAVEVVSESRPRVVVQTILVADACTDDTERLAREHGSAEVVVSDAGRVGQAREIGVETGLAALAEVDPRRTWLANTDADSAVPPNWLAHQLELADAGVDVVIGTVRPDPADLTPEQESAWIASHSGFGPNGHVHGANLGLRASAYRSAGGFAPVDEHEDNLLVDHLRAGGAVLQASDEAEVLTSGRFVGRTPGGYAAHLAGTL